MATFIYNHAVKANGKIIPPNTPVEIPDNTEPKMAEKPIKKSRGKVSK